MKTANSNASHAAYWATTTILAFVLLSGGVASLVRRPENVRGMAELGYPAYMLTILGVWKVLGAIALLAPRFPDLRSGPTRAHSSTSRGPRGRTPRVARA